MGRLNQILGAQSRTLTVLEQLPCRLASERGCEPFARQAFEYTKEQLKELKVWGRTILCRLCQDPEAWWDMDSGTPTCSSCGRTAGRGTARRHRGRFSMTLLS